MREEFKFIISWMIFLCYAGVFLGVVLHASTLVDPYPLLVLSGMVVLTIAISFLFGYLMRPKK